MNNHTKEFLTRLADLLEEYHCINYYEYQTEKDVLKMFCLALFWPITLVYIIVMLSAEEIAKWLNKGI